MTDDVRRRLRTIRDIDRAGNGFVNQSPALPRLGDSPRGEAPQRNGDRIAEFRRARDETLMRHRITPLRTAYKTISAALWTSSFSMIRARCVSTVPGLICRTAAISLLLLPSAMS